MKHIKLIILAISICFLPLTAFSKDVRVDFAKSLTAKSYDKNLPPTPIDQWLKETLGDQFYIEWGESITGCGEQTGNPEIDRERDMPLCAEVSITDKDTIKAYLLLLIGTEKNGNLSEGATLYLGTINKDGKQTTIKNLHELKNIKK